MDIQQWRQVDHLLQSALALPSRDRDAFVRQACVGDEALEREVRSLLASQQQAGSFLESPAIDVAARALASHQKKASPANSELKPGQTLSRFRIVGLLGRGGMGVVYSAEDQKLGRSVALKLLPEATRQDPAALERFWREARTASSLNHSGICTIYELDDSGDQPFLVMELLQGQSLDKLEETFRKQPMPYPRLLDFGVQVADALDAAHRKGIVHRDLKPSNLFLSPSGQAKILDFGLAKLEEGSSGAVPRSTASENVAELLPDKLLTSPGLAIGTIAYMSPEQARGESLDARSDVFSLGVVLYELATGKHPFAGATTAITFDHILNAAPVAPITLNPELPLELEETLNKTLEKDRELRLQSAAELRADLKRLQRKISGASAAWPAAPASATQSVTVAVAKVNRKSRALPVLLLALLLLAAGGFAAWRVWPRPAPFSSVSVSQITNLGTLEDIALSADGKFLAEVTNDASQRTVWLRNIATNTATQILGAFLQEYVGLTFSPDANYLYFTRADPSNNAVRALYAMPVFGGKPRLLINDVNSAPSFSPDGNRFAYLRWTPNRKDQYSEIHIAGKDGDNDQTVYASPYLSRAPAWSPQGNQIAWIESRGTAPAVIKIYDVVSKNEVSITQPNGILLDPVPNPPRCDLAWLPDGRHLLVLYTKPLSDRAQIGIVSVPSGDFSPLTNDVNAYSQLALSGDGKTLATVLTNVDSGLAYYNGAGGPMIARTPLRVTPSYFTWPSEDHLLLITRGLGISRLERATGSVQPLDTVALNAGVYISTCPNGQVVFTADAAPGGEHLLFRMNGDGSGVTALTTSGSARAPSCTPDSRKVYFTIRDKVQMSGLSLWSVPLEGGTPQKEFDVQGQGSVLLSRDSVLAGVLMPQDLAWYAVIRDLATHQTVHRFALDRTGAIRNSYPGFSPDGKAIVVGATDRGGNTLLYQPFDGSPAHPLTEPTSETLSAFAWSPSGSLLGVLQVRKSSDVVLILDLTGKRPH